MRVAVRAWELREAVRVILGEDDRAAEVVALAQAACRLHTTPRGQRLWALALWRAGQLPEAYRLIKTLLNDKLEER
jgi:hypothetical protein